MKTILAIYEHSTIGFPEVKLKWIEERGKITEVYVTIKGEIQKGGWSWHNPHPNPFMVAELEKFDQWVRAAFLNVFGEKERISMNLAAKASIRRNNTCRNFLSGACGARLVVGGPFVIK